jgi:hypothetical protein
MNEPITRSKIMMIHKKNPAVKKSIGKRNQDYSHRLRTIKKIDD